MFRNKCLICGEPVTRHPQKICPACQTIIADEIMIETGCTLSVNSLYLEYIESLITGKEVSYTRDLIQKIAGRLMGDFRHEDLKLTREAL